ncbi:MAG TPA: hypothetical protein VN442_24430 [Bryobacteraceae bacterium]|nr:hypothetical protein [Bryobacteraceae bacterium]
MFARLSLPGLLYALCAVLPSNAQMAGLRPAPSVQMPAQVDSNSPVFWRGQQVRVVNSANSPVISDGDSQFDWQGPRSVAIDQRDEYGLWIEAAWTDSDGSIYAWYHHEPSACGGQLVMPEIGALVSRDGGDSFINLGPVLTGSAPPDCGSQNGFFAGGHGDFSVIFDPRTRYFYFLFGNYGGPVEEQGVAIARMPFDHRDSPSGAVWKYYGGKWREPGLGGRTTPVFQARVSWQDPATESFWGPSIHWNTFLQTYVILMNRSCCRPDWPQEGIYISFNRYLNQPERWTAPERILERPQAYYPQVVGLGSGGTDTVAGEVARLYVQGVSKWEIVFRRTDNRPSAVTPPDQQSVTSP